MTAASAGLLAELDALDLVTDPDVVEGYRRDQAAPGLLEAGMPLGVVCARTTTQVQATVRAAGRAGVPVVPRGAGTGSAAAPTPSTAAWSSAPSG